MYKSTFISNVFLYMSCQLDILSLKGQKYSLQVNENDIMRFLKIKIRDLNGPHPDSQIILYRGKELDDNEKLENYINVQFNKTGIKHMMLDEHEITKFKLRLENGDIMDLFYNIKKEGNTIQDLKIHLLRIFHIQVSNIGLSIDNINLEDNQKITFLDADKIIDFERKNKI